MRSYKTWLQGYQPIAGAALESDIIGIWWSKQSAKGTPATMTGATGKRGRMVGGDLQVNRVDGSEPYSDTTLFGNSADFVNTLIGNGAPVVQGQSGVIAHLFWIACGQETVTGGTNAQQTLTVAATPTAGTSSLSVQVGTETYTASNVSNTATAAQVQTALGNATSPDGAVLGTAQVTTTGGPLGTASVVVTFQGTAGNQAIALITVSATTGTPITVASTTPGVMYQHTATPSDTGGFYFSMMKSIGKTVNVRHQFNDCRIQSLRIEGSSASKVVKCTPTFISLDPGQLQNADPTQADDNSKPFIYTEAVGSWTIDGTVYKGQTAFALVFTWGLVEIYGDDVTPYDLTNTRANVTLEGITMVLDQLALSRYYVQYYGTPTPAAGARPIHTLPAIGSYSATFTRAGESLQITIPGVKWNPDVLHIPANPTGGPTEFPLAGEMRKVPGQPPFTIVTSNYRDPAFTV